METQIRMNDNMAMKPHINGNMDTGNHMNDNMESERRINGNMEMGNRMNGNMESGRRMNGNATTGRRRDAMHCVSTVQPIPSVQMETTEPTAPTVQPTPFSQSIPFVQFVIHNESQKQTMK